MKSLLAIAALMAATLPTLSPAKEKGGTVEQTLTRIEHELLDSLLKGDPAAFDRYLADTFTFTGPDGMVEDKARTIADLKSGDLKFTSSKLDDMKVQSYGSTAVVTYGSTDQGSYKGKDISGRFRWTDVFMKRNGQWKLISGHGSPLAAK